MQSMNTDLAGFAKKSIMEVRYYLRHSEDWVVRLGDGTKESNRRLQDSLNVLWAYTGDLFDTDEVDINLYEKAITSNPTVVQENWIRKTNDIFEKSNVAMPQSVSKQRK